jgi:hypothetical protein
MLYNQRTTVSAEIQTVKLPAIFICRSSVNRNSVQSGKTIEVVFEMTKVCKAVWLLAEHKVYLHWKTSRGIVEQH